MLLLYLCVWFIYSDRCLLTYLLYKWRYTKSWTRSQLWVQLIISFLQNIKSYQNRTGRNKLRMQYYLPIMKTMVYQKTKSNGLMVAFLLITSFSTALLSNRLFSLNSPLAEGCLVRILILMRRKYVRMQLICLVFVVYWCTVEELFLSSSLPDKPFHLLSRLTYSSWFEFLPIIYVCT